MDNEVAFLGAVRRDPGDLALRLVYADWLEEQGDPRAELVRIEEEMHELPVYSDRYWVLKPRRNQLRLAAPRDWLETLQYGTTIPTDVSVRNSRGLQRDRWRLIREYTEQWQQAPFPDVRRPRR